MNYMAAFQTGDGTPCVMVYHAESIGLANDHAITVAAGYGLKLMKVTRVYGSVGQMGAFRNSITGAEMKLPPAYY